MKEKTYWRLISLSPLVIPLVLFFGPELRTSLAGSPSPPASVAQIFSLGTLFIAGVPYLLFLVLVQSVIWSKPIGWDRRSTLIAPPVFLLLFLIAFQIYWSITATGNWLESPRVLFVYSGLVLIIGYLYVGLAWLFRQILRGVGILKKDEFVKTEG